jgi:hypothetical protein
VLSANLVLRDMVEVEELLQSFRSLATRAVRVDSSLSKRLNYARTAVSRSRNAAVTQIGVAVIQHAFEEQADQLWRTIVDLGNFENQVQLGDEHQHDYLDNGDVL